MHWRPGKNPQNFTYTVRRTPSKNLFYHILLQANLNGILYYICHCQIAMQPSDAVVMKMLFSFVLKMLRISLPRLWANHCPRMFKLGSSRTLQVPLWSPITITGLPLFPSIIPSMVTIPLVVDFPPFDHEKLECPFPLPLPDWGW